MDFQGRNDIKEALSRVGELLAAEGHEYAIVVLGGAALDLLEMSIETPATSTYWLLLNPVPAARRRLVQWENRPNRCRSRFSAPPKLSPATSSSTRIGYDLIFFKLFAAADSGGPNSGHYKDLIALRPSASELSEAASWVETQDASSDFPGILKLAVDRARKDLGLD